VGSYPTVSPLPSAVAFCNPLARIAFRPSTGFPADGHRGALHRRFIFCGTVRNRRLASLARTARSASPLALPGALPFGLRRFTKTTFVPFAKREDHGVRTFLPASLLAKDGPAITRLARQCKYITMAFCPYDAWRRKVRGGAWHRRPAGGFAACKDCRKPTGGTPAPPNLLDNQANENANH
jgi:hypothetical protein